MNTMAGISLISSVIGLFIGIAVYYKNPYNRTSVLFTLMCLLFSFTAFVDYGFRSSDTLQMASLWLHSYICWVFSLSITFHFTLAFTERFKFLKRKRSYPLIYGPAIIFMIIDLPSGIITGTPVRKPWGWSIQMPRNFLFDLSSVWSVLVIVIIIYLFFKYYRKLRGPDKKRRTRYVLIGFLIASVIIYTTTVFFPYMGISSPSLFMPALVVAYAIIGYAIWRHKLFILNIDTAADTIIDTISDILLLINADRKIEQVNPAALDLLGYEEEGLIGVPVEKVLPNFKKCLRTIKKNKAARGEYVSPFVGEDIETLLVTKNEKTIPVLLSISMIHDSRNELLGAVCIARDVTEHKKAKEIQRQSEERYHLLVENAPVGIFSINREGFIVDINKELLRMIGSPEPDRVKGINIDEISDLKEAGMVDKFGRCLDTGERIITDFVCKTKSQEEIHCKYYLTPTKDIHGNITGVQAIIEDITKEVKSADALQKAKQELEERVEERTQQLKTANEELAEEKELLGVTLHSIGDGVVTTDKVGNVILLNRVAEKLAGLTSDKAKGKLFRDIFQLEFESPMQKDFDPISAVITSDSVVSSKGKTYLILHDGTKRIVSHSGAPIRDKSGIMVGVVFVIRDITETKHMEEELFRARKLESVGQLAGGIASDFNNLLSNIITNLFAAKMNVDANSVSYKFFQEAEKAAFEASSLTKHLVVFSSDEKIIKIRISIKSVIEDSIGFILSGSKVDYHLDFPEDLKLVEIDRGLMDQVINSVVRNAEQAMPEGGTITFKAENITLTHKNTVPLDTGEYVKVSIQDEGHGIPKSDIAQIFDPFFSTREGGSGIGLSLAYAIIRKHNGYINITSEEEKGTTVLMYLPACEEEEDDKDGTE